MGYFNLEQYEPVENRIRAFWLKYPNGRLLTDLNRTERADGRVEWICRTEAYTSSDNFDRKQLDTQRRSRELLLLIVPTRVRTAKHRVLDAA